ncbi:hypothetical protein BUALT_Bualt05G0070800 [Buddleja alternifolia]|uniref:Legumain prodomain domain-containing protein n=1 Tax=Buddleja alternifolia TaxID=168488 RepID=A0AAV6XIS5_9LAMI|nr:hypothetical protein BUALT_Bualt05G0070800 [Buddleja alternifolia]
MEDGTGQEAELLKQITDTMLHREHLDGSIDTIGLVLFGAEKGPSILRSVRGHSLPLADDRDCLKSTVRLFEAHCGSLTQYGMKYGHMQIFVIKGSPNQRWKKLVWLHVVGMTFLDGVL